MRRHRIGLLAPHARLRSAVVAHGRAPVEEPPGPSGNGAAAGSVRIPLGNRHHAGNPKRPSLRRSRPADSPRRSLAAALRSPLKFLQQQGGQVTALIDGFSSDFVTVIRQRGIIAVNGADLQMRAIGCQNPTTGPGTFTLGVGLPVRAGLDMGDSSWGAGGNFGERLHHGDFLYRDPNHGDLQSHGRRCDRRGDSRDPQHQKRSVRRRTPIGVGASTAASRAGRAGAAVSGKQPAPDPGYVVAAGPLRHPAHTPGDRRGVHSKVSSRRNQHFTAAGG